MVNPFIIRPFLRLHPFCILKKHFTDLESFIVNKLELYHFITFFYHYFLDLAKFNFFFNSSSKVNQKD